MATDMEKLIIGTSEEDDEEDLEMGVKGEDDEDNNAKTMVNVDGAVRSTGNDSLLQHQSQMQEQIGNSGGGSRRCRPLEEKERTKLRERHRRAITARILAGLRRHGNYNLRVRADINDVIGALAREAGWVVLPDGTTFPSRSQGSKHGSGNSNAGTSSSPQIAPQQEAPSTSLGGVSSGYQNSTEYNICNMKGIFVPDSSHYNTSSKNQQSQTPSVLEDGQHVENQAFIGGCIDDDGKQTVDIPLTQERRDFVGTTFVPVYVMLPLGVINMKSELTDPDGILKQLRILKSVNIDGVSVDCWWGIVEAHAPQEYNWNGYRRLFQMVHELNLKLRIVMSFHECGGNVGDDVCIPLPHWVAEIGRSNPDIFFTDRDGRRNPECLSWGVDKERILKGRTAIEIYFDYMRSFRTEFHDYFEDGIISMIEVGLGPCGELRYPSSPVKHGWRYPGIGSFQCYDQYMLKSLRKASEARGQPFWGRGPDNAGSYNSRPQETGFFCEGGDYDGYYGKFFLTWYARMLLDHADRVLSLAKLAFEGTYLSAKLPSIHWWYRTASHAAELTAGYYNPSNKDGYAAIATVLKKHGVVLNFLGLQSPHDDLGEPMANPNGLAWQVLNAAWDASVLVTSENSLCCHDRSSYNKILDGAKPLNNPDGQHLLAFTFLRLSPHLLETHSLVEFELFVKRMHGEADFDVHQ